MYLQKLIGIQTISYDKVNSLRHVRYLKDKAHTLELMKKHAAILNPKFQCVLRHLDTEIAPLGIASWQRPKGGYFVSVNTKPGLAKRTLALCKEAGVVMTGAGATFPYGRDPQDSNIRIAPSLPPVEELSRRWRSSAPACAWPRWSRRCSNPHFSAKKRPDSRPGAFDLRVCGVLTLRRPSSVLRSGADRRPSRASSRPG